MHTKFKPALIAGILLALGQASSAATPGLAQAQRTVTSTAPWTVTAETSLSELTIAEGAQIKAADGYVLSMLVNGVDTAMVPGTYRGDIVIVPSKGIPVLMNSMGSQGAYTFRAAAYIKDGKLIADQSVTQAVKGKVSDTQATGVRINSVGDAAQPLNGLIIDGNSNYKVSDVAISFKGNAGNDFIGQGAGISVSGKSTVEVKNARINNSGTVRTAIWAGGDANLTLRNLKISTSDGVLPDDYEFSITPGKMKETPWVLGFRGNNRALVITERSTVNIHDSHIKAQKWAALSTDGTEHIRINVFNSTLETAEQGYGSLAIGDALLTFNKTRFKTATTGFIMLGSGAGIFDGSTVNSRGAGVVMEGAFGESSFLTIRNGSDFRTVRPALQSKGATTRITVDSSKLSSESGIVFESFPNDDPFMAGGLMGDMQGGAAGGMPAGGPPGGAGGFPGGAPGGAGGPPGGAAGGMQAGGPPGGGPPGGGAGGMDMPAPVGYETSKQLTLIVRNSKLTGDVLHGDALARDMTVQLEGATITGTISATESVHARGPNGEELSMSTPELVDLIGKVSHNIKDPGAAYGVKLSLDGKSTWVLPKSAYLRELTIVQGAKISAAGKQQLTMLVDGKATPIQPGHYTGRIELQTR